MQYYRLDTSQGGRYLVTLDHPDTRDSSNYTIHAGINAPFSKNGDNMDGFGTTILDQYPWLGMGNSASDELTPIGHDEAVKILIAHGDF